MTDKELSKRAHKIYEVYNLMEQLSNEHGADGARIKSIEKGTRIELDFRHE